MVNRLYVLIFYYDFPHRRPISEIAQTYKRGCSEGGKPNSRFYLAICREKEQQKASGVRRQEVCLICNMHLNTHICRNTKVSVFRSLKRYQVISSICFAKKLSHRYPSARGKKETRRVPAAASTILLPHSSSSGSPPHRSHGDSVHRTAPTVSSVRNLKTFSFVFMHQHLWPFSANGHMTSRRQLVVRGTIRACFPKY